jgi:dTDP-4-amino-4,6-dideoxygalactose transaminase
MVTAAGHTQVPLLDLHAQNASIGGAIDEAINGVLAHGSFIGGPEIEQFEEAFARYCGVTSCIGTSSGTSSIELVLRAAGVGPGDEVITTPMTFVATVEPILLVGARPVLADVDPDTALLRTDAVEAAITPRTAAVLPVHLYGQPVDLDAFRALADRHGLFLLEDASQAHGASWRGRRAGSVGDAAVFSFFPGKNLGALGDAGAVTTSDDVLARRIRKLRNHGRTDKYRHDVIGTNARLDTLQAAALGVKLPHLDGWNAARRRHACHYDAALSRSDSVFPLLVRDDALCVYHQYVVRLAERDATRDALAARGVGSGVHYPIPLHRQPALESLLHAECPVADALAGSVLSLPVFPELTVEQRDRVVWALVDSLARGVGTAGAQ